MVFLSWFSLFIFDLYRFIQLGICYIPSGIGAIQKAYLVSITKMRIDASARTMFSDL